MDDPSQGRDTIPPDPVRARDASRGRVTAVPEDELLSVKGLEVVFPTPIGVATVVADVDLTLHRQELFGLIGETGAGKSLTAWAVLGLVPPPGEITRGDVLFKGESLRDAATEDLRRLRGSEMGVIVQNPRAALNPMLRIGDHVANTYLDHHDATRKEAQEKALEALRVVGMPTPKLTARRYAHQVSGGMAQRVLIAMALVNRPSLVIADEPTTGLDVTIQADILDLMTRLVEEQGSTIWLITHDMGVIANYTDRAAVMFAGQIVETGSTKDLFSDPWHPYTMDLVMAGDVDESPRAEASFSPPDLVSRPRGCQFAYRCRLAEPDCEKSLPQLVDFGDGHAVRCFVAERNRQRGPDPVDQAGGAR
jgi:oligopeptide/dipeptide ABC transporter ATP-binding protein